MHAMGVSPKTGFDIEGRPFYVTEDGKGKPVMDIFFLNPVPGKRETPK